MKHDVGELNKPLCFLEFQTGTEGIAHGPKDFTYMQMMLGLLNRGQMALAWTWRTMYGGKEQFYHGVLGHDGYPTQNYEDLKHLARDYRRLEQYAFPYVPKPAIAVALSQDSWWMSSYHPEQFRQSYIENIIEVQKVFFENNLEYNFVNLRNVKNDYKLLIVPGHIMMEESANKTVREFVEKGGVVIMTGYSGMVDGTGPDREMLLDVDYYEQLEISTARSVAEFADKGMCAVSVNTYGKGKAYYVAAESNSELMKWLVDYVTKDMEVGQRFDLPVGVQGRKIAENQYFYVNMNRYPVTFAIPAGGKGVLAKKEYGDSLTLEGYQCELIVGEMIYD